MRESGIEREGKDMNLDVLVDSVLYVCFFTNSSQPLAQPPRRPLRQRSQKSRRNPPHQLLRQKADPILANLPRNPRAPQVHKKPLPQPTKLPEKYELFWFIP